MSDHFKTITVNDVDGSVSVGMVGETLKEMPLEDLLAHIRRMHDEYGDGYHDGTDHAIDYAIEELRKMGFIPQLPENWLNKTR